MKDHAEQAAIAHGEAAGMAHVATTPTTPPVLIFTDGPTLVAAPLQVLETAAFSTPLLDWYAAHHAESRRFAATWKELNTKLVRHDLPIRVEAVRVVLSPPSVEWMKGL